MVCDCCEELTDVALMPRRDTREVLADILGPGGYERYISACKEVEMVAEHEGNGRTLTDVNALARHLSVVLFVHAKLLELDRLDLVLMHTSMLQWISDRCDALGWDVVRSYVSQLVVGA